MERHTTRTKEFDRSLNWRDNIITKTNTKSKQTKNVDWGTERGAAGGRPHYFVSKTPIPQIEREMEEMGAQLARNRGRYLLSIG